ncbi:MAG TPA: hypothetical protein VLG69_03220 [Candidatus Andersenbacteria bacterium]|nr:hypothetical protein [Candidatus Andersenbacteria bacterium]
MRRKKRTTDQLSDFEVRVILARQELEKILAIKDKEESDMLYNEYNKKYSESVKKRALGELMWEND